MGEDRKTIREHYRRLIDSSVAPSLTGDVWLWEGANDTADLFDWLRPPQPAFRA